MRQTFRFGRIAGIPVGANWGVVAVAALLTFSLADGRLPSEAPGYGAFAYAVAGGVGAGAFLASLLAHELGHALLARRHGLAVESITLWLLGGVTRIDGDSPSPGAELRIAGVGPLISLVLGLVFGVGAWSLSAVGAPRLVVAVTGYLALINVVLAVFNLVPAAPLDGGRVLRAGVWAVTRNRPRATIVADRVGEVLGAVLIALGLAGFAFGTGFGGGLWLAFVGWFLFSASRAEESRARMQGALDGVRVLDVMSTSPVTLPGWLTVDATAEHIDPARRHSVYPVEAFGGGVAGLLHVARLGAVPAAERASVRAQDVAVPLADVATGRPDEPLFDLLGRLTPSAGGRALVFDAGRLVGIVTPFDVQRALQRSGVTGLPT